MEIEYRLCRTCHRDKPITEFYVIDGRRKVHCKECFKKRVVENTRARRRAKKNGTYIPGRAKVRKRYSSTDSDFASEFMNWNDTALYC